MDGTTFMVTVFCLIDDGLAGQRLRQRGPQPTLADSEVLTIECGGEFLGIDTDSRLDQYFRRHWGAWFPGLDRVHRTTFVRQAANLWVVNQRLHRHLVAQVEFDPSSAWSIAWPCRSAGSLAPTAAGGCGSWPPGATTRWPSRPILACLPICGSAGQG